jgi:hypothetical protein
MNPQNSIFQIAIFSASSFARFTGCAAIRASPATPPGNLKQQARVG